MPPQRRARPARPAPQQRRLRSSQVIVGALAITVITICTCGFAVGNNRRCVDARNRVIDEINCRGGHGTTGRWYYGGSSKGGQVSGGSYKRGGFGGLFSGGG